MTATPSTMLPLGTTMPAFRLPSVDGRNRVVGILCLAPAARRVHLSPLSVRPAHPTGVRAVRDGVSGAGLSRSWRSIRTTRSAFPEDGPEGMKQEAQEAGLHVSLPLRRDPGGCQGVQGGVHAGPVPVRCARSARLSRAVRRQPAAKSPFRSPERTCARPRQPCSSGNPCRPSRSRASAATSSGSTATSPTTGDPYPTMKRGVHSLVPAVSRRRESAAGMPRRARTPTAESGPCSGQATSCCSWRRNTGG